MGTAACVALKNEISSKFLGKSICRALPVGVGGAMMSVQIFLVISCKGANSYKSHGLRSLTHERKVYLFIYQVKLCDEVVEVLVARVHVRFRT